MRLALKKTKEIVIDFRKRQTVDKHVCINGRQHKLLTHINT